MSAAILGGIPVRTDPWPSWPTWDEAEERALLEVLHSGEWGGYAAGVGEFEQRFAALTGTAHCVTTSNGTVSLVAALAALGVSAGDEVLVPAYTFAATANAVALLGARPVFVDIEPGTWNLDPAAAEAAITDRTRAIVPVHFAGHPVDLDVLLPLAERHGLAVLEDAAHAPGSSWRGRPVGSFGSLASFSFQGFKNLTAGEGGAVVGDDRALIDRAWGMANHGRVRDGSWYEHREVGSNYRLGGFQAAVLLTQLDRYPAQLAARMAAGRRLRTGLADSGLLAAGWDERAERHAHHLLPLRFQPEQFAGIDRDTFARAMFAEGVPLATGTRCR